MKSLLVLVYPGVALGHLTGMAEVFRFANQLAQYLDPLSLQPRYQVQFYHLSGDRSYLADGLQIACIEQPPAKFDALLIPGNYAHQAPELEQVMTLFRAHKDWFSDLQRQGTLLAAGCNGSFALAATGLLDGGEATTCWFLAEYFQQLFPQIQLKAEASVSRSGNCLTAGATTAYLQLCLQLISEFDGVRFSSQLAKVLLVEPALHSQAPFLSVQQLVSHQDERIAAVQSYLRKNLAEPLDLQQLAQRFAMSGRTLIRRFKSATGDTPMAWLQKLRIDKAKNLLETTMMPLEQLTQQVGYEDVSSFRKLFQQYTQMTPKAYRNHFFQ